MSFADRLHGGSLAGRLMLWFVGAAMALVLLTAVLLYFALTNAMQWRDDQVLLKRALTVRDLLAALVIDRDYLDHEVSEDLEGPRQLFMRISGPVSVGVHETPNMPEISPKAGLVLSGGDAEYGAIVSDGRRYRTLVMQVPVSVQSSGGQATLELAIDTSLDVEILNRYVELVGFILAVALILCIVAVWYIVRTQLRPLHQLATAAANIEHSTLDYRVSPEGLPTELREYTNQFNNMLARLETAYDALRRYADDVAHELRTPLNRIQLGAEVALREARTPEVYRESLESTLEECEHLGGMVKSLLFLARAENGQTQLVPASMNVAERLEKIRAFFEGSALDAGVSLTVECDSHLSMVADVTLFQRAVSNLVANAVAHTPRGGRVSMRAAPESAGIMVEVADNGEGIAPENQPHVFNRFFRADQARGHEKDRVGLGLAITKSIVDLHQGRISLQSKVGAGTRFSLYFPAGRLAAE